HHLEAHFDMAAAVLITGLSHVVTVHCDDLDSSYAGTPSRIRRPRGLAANACSISSAGRSAPFG
ncbi:MAG: hypothetical protein AAGF12_13715, partial [Myxococcota bacterium]